MKTTQKSALLALATVAMLSMASPAKVLAQDGGNTTQEAKPKQGHVKIIIEKNGKKEVIDETFEGEMPQELKDRIKAISGTDFTFNFDDATLAGADRQIFIRKFHGKDDTVRVSDLPGAQDREIIIRRADKDGSSERFEFSIDGETLRVSPAQPGTEQRIIRIFKDGEIIKCDSTLKEFRTTFDTNELQSRDGNRVITFKKIIICDNDQVDRMSSEAGKDESKTAEKEFGSSMSDLNFYPNPTAGRISINFKLEKKGDTEITIHDVTGKQVYGEKLKGFSGTYHKEIDLSGNGKGTYIMKVTQGKKMLTKKIVVE